MRIDAHQHFWHYDPVRDAWIDDSMARIRADFLPPDLRPLLETHGFDGCVAVQADQSLAHNDFLLGLSRQYPFIRGVVGWVDLCSATVDEQIASYAEQSGFVGVRHVVQGEAPGFMDRPDFRRGISQLAAAGLTYDILIYHQQLAEATRLVAAFPDQCFILDHVAKPVVAGLPDAAWVGGMQALARHPNVYCKLSGLVTEVPDRDWSGDLLRPYLDVVLGAFGAERVLYGSDWPVCLVAAEYGQQLRVVEAACQALSDAERASIFGGTAARCYGIA